MNDRTLRGERMLDSSPMILVTGGAGYIGSHSCVALTEAGMDIAILDNFSNADTRVIENLEHITGKRMVTHDGDLRDSRFLDSVFIENDITAVLHCAGMKGIGRSLRDPMNCYANNVSATICLLEAMARARCKKLVFASSAAVYDHSQEMPLREDGAIGAGNPYGHSKAIVEEMLWRMHAADPEWRLMILRYFNPAGAHESGLLGEAAGDVSGTLFSLLMRVAAGRSPMFQILGEDYPTSDGTAVRDFVHVVDVAEAHVAALKHLETRPCATAVNLGSGRGVSVREIIQCFEEETGRLISCVTSRHRPGDVAVSVADIKLARVLLGWVPKRDLHQICRDAFRRHLAEVSA